MIRIIIIFLFFIYGVYGLDNNQLLSAMNNEENWVYHYTLDDIRIYRIEHDSLSIIKLVKDVEISNDILNVIAKISDYNNVISNKKIFTEEVILDIPSDTIYGYQKVSNIIPFIKNRHIIFKMFRVEENRLDWQLLHHTDALFNNYNNSSDKILSYGAGSWQVYDNKLIHYYYIDSEISLPEFLLKRATERSVINIFKDVLYFYQFN